ncbi:glycerate kinase [Halobacteriales archaeon QH_8_68_33]|nr:MAG: glycerate kinase [Halobacteriales archaeon QH_8_68_33]
MIRERDRLARSPAHETALACIEAGIEAAHPERVVEDSVSLESDSLRVADATYDLAAYDEVVVVGGGKAAAGVAAALETELGEAFAGGVVVTDTPVETDRVDVVEASHPVPDEAGVDGARRVQGTVERAGAGTLVLAVITGGGSALLPAPAGDLSLSDLRATTDTLLESGAAIDEINAVRRHASALKGGRLAAAAAPATVVTLAFSDVVGDDLGVIASGPTVPDPTTYAEAVAVLDRYDLDVPAAVRKHLAAGAAGEVPETPGADADFDHVSTHVLANAWTAVAAAREVARERGYDPFVLSTRVRGEAREQGLAHVAVAEEVAATGTPVDPPAVVLSGGETTVTVRGDGDGGPNQEFALRTALELGGGASDGGSGAGAGAASTEGTVLAAVDTDGRDGASDAAGALVDADTVPDADAAGAARAALADNDAGTYLDGRDALVRMGRTGTNVNDLRVVVVE